MQQLIRFETFETNSSSTHSLTLDYHYKIESLIEDALELIQELDSTEQLYKILGLLREAEHLIVKNLEG